MIYMVNIDVDIIINVMIIKKPEYFAPSCRDRRATRHQGSARFSAPSLEKKLDFR